MWWLVGGAFLAGIGLGALGMAAWVRYAVTKVADAIFDRWR